MYNYSSLRNTISPEVEGGVMVHVADPTTTSRWSHLKDLDSFFKRIYKYHQKHGFLCLFLEEVFELMQFLFVIFFVPYAFYGINYDLIFDDDKNKVTLKEALFPMNVFFQRIPLWLSIVMVLAGVVASFRLLKVVQNTINYWEMREFFTTALKINDAELDNKTWFEVQKRVRAVQMEHRMSIHKPDLTELDIYHRILRQENYLVAMVNKKLLPPRINLPLIGEIVYVTKGLLFNIRLLLFRTLIWSPFEYPWQLREEFQKSNLRVELASKLKKNIVFLFIINCILMPFIFVWQVLDILFNYTELVKREPGVLAVRNWSLYGQYYLRHFNELEHELQARLSRAHKPAKKYMAAFPSPLLAVIAKPIVFFSGAILNLILIITIRDEDVLHVEHIFMIITITAGIYVTFLRLMQSDTSPQSPETLLTNVAAETHYFSFEWKGQAHTSKVRAQFQQLYQFSLVTLLEKLLSPILTPFFLLYYIYPRALDFVDFFRNFTVSVVGVGHVSSFAQMDIKKHGNIDLKSSPDAPKQAPTQYDQAEDGKTELSLIHFKLTNPEWQAPQEAEQFISNVLSASMSESRNRENDFLSGDHEFAQSDPAAVRLPTPEDATMYNAWRTEGPSLSAAREMTNSAIFLHNRYFRPIEQSSLRIAEEHTPLLSTN